MIRLVEGSKLVVMTCRSLSPFFPCPSQPAACRPEHGFVNRDHAHFERPRRSLQARLTSETQTEGSALLREGVLTAPRRFPTSPLRLGNARSAFRGPGA